MPSFSITGLNVRAMTKSSPASASQAAGRMSRAAAIKRPLGRASDQRELGLTGCPRLDGDSGAGKDQDSILCEVGRTRKCPAARHVRDLDRIGRATCLLLPVDG